MTDNIMIKIIETLANLIPKITHPFSLIAFSLFVVVFLLTKLLLGSNLIRPIREHHSFAILNKILNIAGISLILIILLAFPSYIYLKKAEQNTEKHYFNRKEVKQCIDKIEKSAIEFKSKKIFSSRLTRLQNFQPEIYKLGRILKPKLAYQTILKLQQEYKVPELTPALLPVSRWIMSDLFDLPFNYLPTSNRSTVYARHGGIWNADFDGIDLKYINLMLESSENFPYKDIIYFLEAIDPLVWKDVYKDSFFIDASFYVAIRTALVNENFNDAIDYANRFKNAFPNHRHLDDSYALKTIVYQNSGNLVESFLAAIEGTEMPDGDMKHWLSYEVFQIAESLADSKQLNEIIKNCPIPSLIPLLRYTQAHHLATEGKHKDAIEILSLLIKAYPKEKVCHLVEFSFRDGCLSQIELEEDIKLFSKLHLLNQDATPEGRFELGCFIYDNELVHYNRLFMGLRRKIYERIYLREYCESRNNFFIALKYFKEVASKTNHVVLKQKAYYKVGRCYEHLSYGPSFYTQDDFSSRKRFAQQCVKSFLQGIEIHPSSSLADDCLAEAALQTYLLLGDKPRAIFLFKRVLDEYTISNAFDNSLYWLGVIYKSKGELANAIETWGRLCVGLVKEKWKRIGCRLQEITKKETGFVSELE